MARRSLWLLWTFSDTTPKPFFCHRRGPQSRIHSWALHPRCCVWNASMLRVSKHAMWWWTLGRTGTTWENHIKPCVTYDHIMKLGLSLSHINSHPAGIRWIFYEVELCARQHQAAPEGALRCLCEERGNAPAIRHPGAIGIGLSERDLRWRPQFRYSIASVADHAEDFSCCSHAGGSCQTVWGEGTGGACSRECGQCSSSSGRLHCSHGQLHESISQSALAEGAGPAALALFGIDRSHSNYKLIMFLLPCFGISVASILLMITYDDPMSDDILVDHWISMWRNFKLPSIAVPGEMWWALEICPGDSAERGWGPGRWMA